MADKTNFALRLHPSMKEAAKGLVGTYLHDHSLYGTETFDGVALSSINDSLCYLLQLGVRKVVEVIQTDLAVAKATHDTGSDIMRFFLENPVASYALPANFKEGSPARREIQETMDLQHEDFPQGYDRSWFTDEYAQRQHRVWNLTKALGVAQKAVGNAW